MIYPWKFTVNFFLLYFFLSLFFFPFLRFKFSNSTAQSPALLLPAAFQNLPTADGPLQHEEPPLSLPTDQAGLEGPLVGRDASIRIPA